MPTPTPRAIYDVIWAVLTEWRPGMSAEVKDKLARKIADRIVELEH